jgi:CDP-archaeol synthase
MQPDLVLQLLWLLLLANGTPVIAKRIFGRRYSRPLDGDLQFADGRPLFGQSKTIRGVLLAILVTTAGADLVGLGWRAGLLVGGLAMMGDLFSSFVKRRLGMPSSSQAIGLDQLPESLFPLLASRMVLPVTPVDIAVCVILFFVGEMLLSRLLFTLRVRDRPY